MDVVIVNQQEVGALLPMRECIDVMERVFRSLADGDCSLPLRQIMWLPEKTGALGLMPSSWGSTGMLGVKVVTFFPGNEGTELDSHQGAVLLFEAQRGRLLAMIDATSITAIRTAAVSALATKLLAKADASDLAIIGSGVQAQMHLEAMLIARRITRVRVASKTLKHAESFADEQSDRHYITIEPCPTVRQAVEGADLICTTTSAREPVLQGDWIKPGVHINAVGSSVASARELDAAAVAKARLIVDRTESALNEAGDFLLAKAQGVIGDDHIVAELGDVLAGRVVGRRTDEEITLFKSVGLAVEDLAAALHIYEKAQKTNAGRRTEFGGSRRATH